MFKVDIDGLDRYRSKTVEDILELLKCNDRVCCTRYTGFGKSYYIVPKLIQELNEEVLILVPSLSLQYQYYECLLINSLKARVQTYQSIRFYDERRIRRKYNHIKYIICDECHHLGKNNWRRELDRFNSIVGAKIIGITATPIRGDSINIVDEYFNGVQIEPLELIDGINLGFVPQIKYVVAYAEIEDKYNPEYNPKYNEIDRYKIQNLLKVENILKKYITDDYLKDNAKILVFVPEVKYIDEAERQCENWFRTFTGYNVRTYKVYYKQSIKDNEQILAKFKRKNNIRDIDILISVDMVTEGLHLPDINIEVMLRKTKSPVKYFQQLGRVVNGKEPIVFDLINNSKHLYQMKRDYEVNKKKSEFNRQKVMFEDCIELMDETRDIREIIHKYINPNRIDDYTRLEILKDVKNGLKYKDVAEKYNVSIQSVSNILRELNYKKHTIMSDEDLHSVYLKNKAYIQESNGVINRPDICDKIGVSLTQFKRLCELEGIELKRMYPVVKESLARKEEFIDIYNNTHRRDKRKYILNKLNITSREYGAYMRDEDVKSKIVRKRKRLNEEDEKYIINYIRRHSDLHRKDLANDMDVSVDVISRLLKKYNIDIPPSKPQRKITLIDEELIIDKYREVGSLYGVYKSLGYHKNTVKKCLIKYGMWNNEKADAKNK